MTPLIFYLFLAISLCFLCSIVEAMLLSVKLAIPADGAKKFRRRSQIPAGSPFGLTANDRPAKDGRIEQPGLKKP